jgi:hypothetical protein
VLTKIREQRDNSVGRGLVPRQSQIRTYGHYVCENRFRKTRPVLHRFRLRRRGIAGDKPPRYEVLHDFFWLKRMPSDRL